MEFPSLEFTETLAKKLNRKIAFRTAARWSDVRLRLSFGDKHYYLKLYGGKVIDVRDYSPFLVPLGWDFSISASLEVWKDLISGKRNVYDLIPPGHFVVDGNMTQANRLYEAIWLIVETASEIKTNAKG
jgi:putative sterol carrier protein